AVVQLALLAAVVRRFQLENPAFQHLLTLLVAAVVVHHLLPLKWRLPFFLALSAASIVVVLGFRPAAPGDAGWLPRLDWKAGAGRGALLIGLACAIVALCRLRMNFWTKALLVAGVGAVLAVFRSGYGAPDSLAVLWPILGSMFMFRVIIYLYDVQHEKEPPGFVRSLAYFLMLPNVCFPFFPVVDYRTYARGHYNEDALVIYQKGLNWMARGVVQLILYRVVYYHFAMETAHVGDGRDVVHCLAVTMLKYLMVSGHFHLVIGLLHLFGFNLPETNRRYFLAASFTDYWRRVNIYWKDFILKVFYNPTYFRFKGRGPTFALVVATAFSFLVTWALHSYQSFWISGTFLLKSQDALFWGVLGLLVIANSLREARKGRARSLTPRAPTWPERLGLAARTAGTFALLSVLWSLWYADSLAVWAQMWSMADVQTLVYGAVVLVVIGAAAIGSDYWDGLLARLCGTAGAAKLGPRSFSMRQAAVMCLLPAAGLYVLSSPRFQARTGEQVGAFLASLSNTRPNEFEQDQMERGYYENLMDVGRSNPALAALIDQRPADWKRLEETSALTPSGDFRLNELVPSRRTEVNGFALTTNRWGMRDRDYEQAKPAGTFRIALLGASTAMGWGVEDDETFENLLEDRLNRQPPPGSPCRRFEVLNFGVNGYSAICDLVTLERKVLAFEPDAVMVMANATDEYWAKQRLAKSIRAGVAPPYEYLRQVVERTGIHAKTTEQAALVRLNKYGGELVSWAYRETARRSRTAGAVPIWFLIPRVIDGESKRAAVERLTRMAVDGEYVVIDLAGIYQGYSASELVLAPWDAHPNAKGHALVADALYRSLCSEAGARV
ncbi:MAG: hypothetical protein HRF43_01015, partial [Phycisphaerae bacterium]